MLNTAKKSTNLSFALKHECRICSLDTAAHNCLIPYLVYTRRSQQTAMVQICMPLPTKLTNAHVHRCAHSQKSYIQWCWGKSVKQENVKNTSVAPPPKTWCPTSLLKLETASNWANTMTFLSLRGGCIYDWGGLWY